MASFDTTTGKPHEAGHVRVLGHYANLNADYERWIRSIKTEVLSRLVLFGKGSWRHCLDHYLSHDHSERNPQGQGSAILFSAPADRIGESSAEICTRECLVGLLRFYDRETA